MCDKLILDIDFKHQEEELFEAKYSFVGLFNFILVLMGKGAKEFYSELVEKFILNLWYS